MFRVYALDLMVILALCSLILVDCSSAQISKPAIPTFTLALQDEAVVLSIENQPFDIHNSNNYSFYYDVRVMNVGGYWSSFRKDTEVYPTQSESNYTTFSYTIGNSQLFPSLTTLDGIPIPTTGEATFQVMALVGTLDKSYSYPDGSFSLGLKGQVSGWSSSQTITLPSTNASSPEIYVSPMGGMSTSYRLTLFSPNEQVTYDGVLPLEFMLSWTYDIMPVFEPRTDYAYSIDGTQFVSITANKTSNDRPGGGYTFVYNPSFSYKLDVSGLTNGRHELAIRANFDFGHSLLNDTSRSFSFTVQNSNPRINPSSTPPPGENLPKPSVPEFTLKFVDKSYTTADGVYYDSKTMQVTIANQPSLNHSLFYNVRYSVNGGDWLDIYTMDDAFPPQSSSECTIISVYLHPQGNATIVPANSVVDVQVQAMIGYIHREYNPNHTSQLDMYPYVFTGETSGWSPTQTLTIPDSPSPTEFEPNFGPTSAPAHDIGELAKTLASVASLISIFCIIVLLLYVKRMKRKLPEN